METHLLRRIEKHLRRYTIPPTRFGREAAHDPRLVLDLRNGREPGPGLSEKVHRYMDEVERRASR